MIKNCLDSAANQQLSKISLSDSFNSDISQESEKITYEELEFMIDQLYSTLLKSKLLPKDYPKPQVSYENLSFLINTLCDEFLLEIDLPMTKTHCSTEYIQSAEETKVVQNEDLINKILFAKSEIVLSEQNCKDLSALILELVRNSHSSHLKKQKEKLEEKIIRYGQELLQSKKTLKTKEKEIKKLKYKIEELLEEKDLLINFSTPEKLNKYSYEGALSESTDS